MAARVRRAYRFRLRPTRRQAALLEECLEDHRQLYNAALEERREAWRRHGISQSYKAQSCQLPAIRGADPAIARWAAASLQATLRRCHLAFEAFFRRCEAGEKPGYPRIKGPGWWDTVIWPQDRNGCAWLPDQRRVYLKGIGHVRVHAHREVLGEVKTISVKREGAKWHLILSCDDVPVQALPGTGRAVGIDMGVASFLTSCTGQFEARGELGSNFTFEHVENPRWLRTATAALTVAQRAVSRCSRHSNRRRKAQARVAALHARVQRRRKDFHHKVALDLVRKHDVIVHEDLQITNMTRSAHGTIEAPGVNVAQKAGLNRSILDAGWGSFLRIVASKAESAGRQSVAVNPRWTSLTCPCGNVDARNRVDQARFVCVRCGYAAHADEVAAEVILGLGLDLRASEKPKGGVTLTASLRS